MSDMKSDVFSPKTRVEWIETGEKGTVVSSFIDGYVALRFDDGCPAELLASSLRRIRSKGQGE